MPRTPAPIDFVFAMISRAAWAREVFQVARRVEKIRNTLNGRGFIVEVECREEASGNPDAGNRPGADFTFSDQFLAGRHKMLFIDPPTCRWSGHKDAGVKVVRDDVRV